VLDRFREFVTEYGLIHEGSRVLVGLSGGADSTCLLHLLHRSQIDSVAAHLNHGQRPEAESDVEHCSAFAGSLGIPFVSGKADVPGIARERKIGIEEAGREARYAFFEDAAVQTGCNLIATAHTRTDLAETVLLNLIRGSGMGGLSGIPLQRGNIIRPLLFETRQATLDYCQNFGLATLDDSTNKDLKYARPRIREKVMPELLRIHPGAETAIARLAGLAGEENEFLDSAAAAGLERCEELLNGDLRFLTLDIEARLKRSLLRHLPPVLLRRALRLLAETLGGKLDFEGTFDLYKRVLAEEKGSYTCEGGKVVLAWKADELHAYRESEHPPFKDVLRVPGDTFCDPYNWRLSCVLTDHRNGEPRRASFEALIDLDGFRGPLHFRSIEPGDRLIPLGAKGNRKLSDLMGEAKLTLAARKRLPIICDIIGPIWAPGVALAERVRVSPGAKKALLMVFAPISSAPAQSETLSGV
jgi:tRNA(Ile)-lysidine synthase